MNWKYYENTLSYKMNQKEYLKKQWIVLRVEDVRKGAKKVKIVLRVVEA